MKLFFITYKKQILALLPVLILLVGFNGYLNPFQIRVFGDTTPRQPVNDHPSYEFFSSNFSETWSPSFNAPYSYQISHARFFLSHHFPKTFVDWVLIFFPFLISSYLAYYFFYALSEYSWLGLWSWCFYIFSTFYLFTSSIHTNILTALNLILFFLFLWFNFARAEESRLKTIQYILFGASSIIVASVFDLRMILVTAPFFLAGFAYPFFRNRTQTIRTIVYAHLAIVGIVILNFIYLFINLSSIAGAFTSLTSRSTWGNEYFHLINTLAISHPFWNGGQAVNFIYNSPSPVLLCNILFTGLIIFAAFLIPNNRKYYFIFFIPLIFFLFLSKENHPPFTYIYEKLYSFPYFSFSREASKYFYGYILSLTAITALVVSGLHQGQLKSNRYKFIIVLALISATIPMGANFYVFATGKYMNSTRAYPYNSDVYTQINKLLEQKNPGDSEVRVLWLPLMNTLQDNTPKIKHMSFPTLLSLYPLKDVRTESRNYLFEALQDENFKNYIRLMNFKYIILPDMSNEPAMLSQLKVLYSNYDDEEFQKYVLSNLPTVPLTTVSGYKIYELQNSPSDTKVVDNLFNSEYGTIGNIETSSTFTTASQPPPREALSASFTTSNCNANQEEGLNFAPQDRTQINSIGPTIHIDMRAQFNEVPCVFFHIESPQSQPQKYYLHVGAYEGDPTELTILDKTNSTGSDAKIYRLDKTSPGDIPLSCSNTCDLVLYLFDTDPLGTKKVNADLAFFTSSQIDTNILSTDILSIDQPLHSLDDTTLYLPRPSEYLLVKVPYDPGYRLTIGSTEFKPIENNNHLLLFETKALSPTSGVSLSYLPERKISSSLRLTDIINILTFASALVAMLTL